MKKGIKKALVVSFYKSNNLGDLALSNALSNLIIKKGFEIVQYDFLEVQRVDNNNTETSFTQQPKKRIVDKYPGIRKGLSISKFLLNNYINPEKWKRLEAEILKNDVVIVGGGNMLMDITVIWPYIFEKYIQLAEKYNKDIYILSVGAGPIKYNRSKKIINKSLSKAKYISVRDYYSMITLENINNNLNIHESVDLVFSSDIDNFKSRIKNIDLKISNKITIGVCVLGEICFSSSEEHATYMNNLEKAILTLKEKVNKNITFILFSTETLDYSAVNQLYNQLGFKIPNIQKKNINNEKEISVLYDSLDFLIGGRMHSVIFAQKLLVPYLSIVWQKKIMGLAKVIGNTEHMYNISEMENRINDIIYQINYSLSNKELIEKMNNRNKELHRYFEKIKVE